MRFDLGPSLEQARAAALAAVDRLAAERAAALGGETPAHALKREEAARFRMASATRKPEAAGFPLLSAEIGITGASLGEVVALVEARASAWRRALAEIEAERLSTKARLRKAATHPELRALLRAYEAR